MSGHQQWLTGKGTLTGLQLRGSSGFSPLSLNLPDSEKIYTSERGKILGRFC